MNYYATEIDYSFKQIDSITDEIQLLTLTNIKYNNPLVFVTKSHSIIFFNLKVELDQTCYDTLYHLVKNATEKREDKGLSALELFKLVGCKHTKEKSCNNLTEEERADERIRDIKRRIKKTIKDKFNKMNNLCKDINNTNCINITKINEKYGQKQIFCEDIEIDIDSPYYNFEINTVVDSLIINQKNKEKKYSTDFIFKQ